MFGRNLFIAAAAVASLASTVYAAPTGTGIVKRADIDTTVLQFALTLEHLENVFYKEAIKKFSLADFEAAGYSADYYHNLHYIAYDEQEHVIALEAALKAAGVTPNAACTYSFPYTDVVSFITLSSIIENVGTSAYLGAAGLITSKYYLTVAGAILAVEALHTSYQRASIGEIPLQNPFQTPLDPNSVYTLASAFIVSCPSTNAPLPFTAFPTLTSDAKTCTCEEITCAAPSDYIKRGEQWGPPAPKHSTAAEETCSPPVAGTVVEFTAASAVPAGSYLTFVNGLAVDSVAGTISGDNISAKIPAGLSGQTYVFVTKTSETSFSDANVLFGPAILEVHPPKPVLNFSES